MDFLKNKRLLIFCVPLAILFGIYTLTDYSSEVINIENDFPNLHYTESKSFVVDSIGVYKALALVKTINGDKVGIEAYSKDYKLRFYKIVEIGDSVYKEPNSEITHLYKNKSKEEIIMYLRHYR